MNDIHGSLFTILQLGLAYSVCAVVWTTLVVGLYQLVHSKLRHTHLLKKRPHQLLQSQQVN